MLDKIKKTSSKIGEAKFGRKREMVLKMRELFFQAGKRLLRKILIYLGSILYLLLLVRMFTFILLSL